MIASMGDNINVGCIFTKKHGKNFDDQLKNNVTTRKLFEQ